MPVIANKKGGKAVIRVTNASESITLAQLQSAGEVLREVHIVGVYWSGPVTVARNGVTLLNLTDGQDNWVLEGDFAIREQGAFQIDVVATAATLILEVNKLTEDEK